MLSTRDSALTIAIALCPLLMVSCGPSDFLTVHPATGQVSHQGQPAEGAVVVLHPIGGSEALQKVRPRAVTGPDGRFILRTYQPDDGAPEGEYKVTIVWPGPPAGLPPGADVSDLHPDERRTGPDQLEGRYADEGTTELRAVVRDGENSLPTFAIQ